MTQFIQVKSGTGVVAGILQYPMEYLDARKEIEAFAVRNDLRASDMPMAIRAITGNAAVRELARPNYMDFITAEYQGSRNNFRSYEVWHSTGSLSTVSGLESAFGSKDKYRFMKVDEEEWRSSGKGKYAGKDIPRIENLNDLRNGRNIPTAGTPYMCALILPADFKLLSVNTDENTVMEYYKTGKPLIFEAAQLKPWQFRIDDRVLCACGSPENRQALANMLFGSKEEGGEGWSAFGSHHNIDLDGFGVNAIGRPLFFYNNNTGICGRIYGYGNFLASSLKIFQSVQAAEGKMDIVKPAREETSAVNTAQPSHVSGNGKKYQNMVLVKGGSFYMGSPDDEIYHGDDQPGERPRHKVTLDGYYIDSATVTQHDYDKIMNIAPASEGGDNMPAVNVTWYDAVLYCNARSKRDGLDPVYSYAEVAGSTQKGCKRLDNLAADFSKNGYRLPSEAEWEYACRAGTETRFFWGKEIDGSYAWSEINTDPVLRPVRLKKPNAWGLYDMAGNVQEWCNDWFSGSYYAESPENNPLGPNSGQLHVLRGGSNYRYKDRDRLRSANRSCNVPESCGDMCGFRTVARA